MAITVPSAGHPKYTTVYTRVDQLCVERVTRFVLQQRASDAFCPLVRCTKTPQCVALFAASLLGRLCVKFR